MRFYEYRRGNISRLNAQQTLTLAANIRSIPNIIYFNYEFDFHGSVGGSVGGPVGQSTLFTVFSRGIPTEPPNPDW